MNREELLEKLDEWFETVADYGTEEDKQAYQEIVALIKNQSQVTEEWIEHVAKRLDKFLSQHFKPGEPCESCEDFIRKLVEEMPAKKATVDEKWIQQAIEYIAEYPSYKRLEEKLKEAGVDIEKDAS